MVFRNRIAVVSSKGGVGKSSAACFLAKAFAKRLPNRVGLLDSDIHGPSTPKLLKVNPKIEYSGEFIKPIMVDGLKVMSLGFLAPERAAILWGGLKEVDAVWQMTFTVDWGDLDYLIIDMPPGSGDEFKAVMSLIKPNGAIVITTPRLLDSIVIKSISALRLINVPIIGAVENFSGFKCPCGCNKTYFEGDSKMLKQEDIKLLAQVPQDLEYPSAMESAMMRVSERVQAFCEELEEKAVEKKKKEAGK